MNSIGLIKISQKVMKVRLIQISHCSLQHNHHKTAAIAISHRENAFSYTIIRDKKKKCRTWNREFSPEQ